MDLQTISDISKKYGVSTRMLRYYEQSGLITSQRKVGYAYRVYDESAIKRIQQIIILRKLQIPVKQILIILNNPDTAIVIDIFKKNLLELDSEITALSTIKKILMNFIYELESIVNVNLNQNFLSSDFALDIVSSLSLIQKNIKERTTMNELNQANEKMTKLTDSDVRIIYLPPMTIASYSATGENCEGKAGDEIDRFVKESKLLDIKPDARSFGFDCSEQFQGIGEPSQRYQVWVSIPDEMEVPDPLKKIHYCGGNFAAHVLMNWDFEMWRYLYEWVDNSSKYDNNASEEQPALEERLNYFSIINNGSELQLDLLFPIKLKS